MRVIICCESSGVVREAFRARGHDAWSCDLLPADDGSPFHYQCDLREIWDMDFDLWGFHPECTFLNSAGLHWNERGRGHERTEQALEFVSFLMSKRKPWYLENPVGCISTRIRRWDQKLQPYEFGEDASKQTCLWLSGQNRLTPSDNRWKDRARTYEGIARAMAEQWSPPMRRSKTQ